MSNIITGSCQCGNIEIEFNNKKVISAHHCYCKDCQRSTGTGKATILYIPKKHFSLNTELKYYESIGSQGMHIQRGFCENCGSGILSFAKEFPRLLFVKAGILNDSSWIKVESNYFIDSASEWSKPDLSIKSFKGNPNFMSNIKAILKSL